MTDPIRIANCSGFYGDRIAAARESALANLSSVAEGAAADIVERLTGRRPDPATVASAVAQAQVA